VHHAGTAIVTTARVCGWTSRRRVDRGQVAAVAINEAFQHCRVVAYLGIVVKPCSVVVPFEVRGLLWSMPLTTQPLS
jgi:hypothetical protein